MLLWVKQNQNKLLLWTETYQQIRKLAQNGNKLTNLRMITLRHSCIHIVIFFKKNNVCLIKLHYMYFSMNMYFSARFNNSLSFTHIVTEQQDVSDNETLLRYCISSWKIPLQMPTAATTHLNYKQSYKIISSTVQLLMNGSATSLLPARTKAVFLGYF